MDRSTQAALFLLQIKAIKLSPQNPFTWASGIKSPIYCDNRVSLSYPDIRTFLADCFKSIIEQHPECNTIAGVATAGIPMGAIVAHLTGLPFVYVRDNPKKHGRQNQIEGELPERAKVILIEDLISTGGSSIKAANALVDNQAELIKVAAIFSYLLPSAEANFKEAGYAIETITDYPTLIQAAAEHQLISEQDLELLKKWRKDPNNWQ